MEGLVDADEYISRIEELCILHQGEEGSTNDWFNDIRERLTEEDPFTTSVLDNRDGESLNVALLPQLLQLLHSCLLNHRWSEALRVLQKIALIPLGTSHTLWQVGKELMETEESNKGMLLKQLYNKMKVLPDLNPKAVILEFAMYFMTEGDIQGAIQTMQDYIVRPGVKKEKSSKDVYIEKLFRAYTGLLWYMEWSQCREKFTQLQASGGSDFILTPIASQASNIEMQMNNYSKKAVMCFEVLTETPGVWDIFITKHVELLEHDGSYNEALDVLKQYSQKNEENVNAQKYLYHFYTKHFTNSELAVKQLHIIVDLVPSDSLVLELCSVLEKDDVGLQIPYLFQLLDYSCWKDDIRPWQRLADTLEAVIIRREGNYSRSFQLIKDKWMMRRSWWPPYHFCTVASSQPSDDRTNFFKTVTALFMCGKESPFVTQSLETFTDVEQEEFQTLTSQICASEIDLKIGFNTLLDQNKASEVSNDDRSEIPSGGVT